MIERQVNNIKINFHTRGGRDRLQQLAASTNEWAFKHTAEKPVQIEMFSWGNWDTKVKESYSVEEIVQLTQVCHEILREYADHVSVSVRAQIVQLIRY